MPFDAGRFKTVAPGAVFYDLSHASVCADRRTCSARSGRPSSRSRDASALCEGLLPLLLISRVAFLSGGSDGV